MRFALLLSLSLVTTAASAAAPAQLDESFPMPPALVGIWQQEISQGQLPFDARLWAQSLVDGKLDDAAHTWSSVEPALPERLHAASEASFLYLLWRDQLPQTFVNHLVADLARPSFVASPAWQALEPQIAPRLGAYLWAHAVMLTPDQAEALAPLPWTGAATELKAWSLLRGRKAALTATQHLPPVHPWRHLLALSGALDEARAGNVGDAVHLLTDTYHSPGLTSEQQAAVALQLARLTFQQADMKAAEDWYTKVPLDSSWAPEAREELLWVWLRTGDTAKLRGTLVGLTRDQFKDRFLPELYVVRAISNLKLCHYDETKKDIASFVSYNKEWASRIDAAMAAPSPPPPPNADWYAALVARARAARDSELASVEQLATVSATASLPAVGKQKHWLDAAAALKGEQARLTRLADTESKRQWRASEAGLAEAIRKLRFVRIELVSQLTAGAKAEPDSAASAQAAAAAKQALDSEADGKWSFPADGVDWPDEVFAARSAAHTVCL